MAGKAAETNREGDGPHDEDLWTTAEEVETETDGSDEDPTFDALEETRSSLSRMSLSKSRPRSSKKRKSASEDVRLDVEKGEIPQLNKEEEQCFERLEKMIEDGKVDKLKIDECKIYLRKYALRLTGNKGTLQARIKEHLEIMEGGGEKNYPVSSFVLNCKGDACMGDVVMFKQNVYDMFSVVSRSATAPPLGTRTVAGRIVKESYGAAKQQHTFTIEVLWSKGEKPLPPLHPLLIKGRNLYKLKTMRQRWEDEEERNKALQEKHRRGGIARFSRETRILERVTKKITSRKSVKESCGTLARNARHQRIQTTLASEKPLAAGAQNTNHKTTLASKKPVAARHENGDHHQGQDMHNDTAQPRNGGSAQVMQPQAAVFLISSAHNGNASFKKPSSSLQFPSRWDVPMMENRNYANLNVPIQHWKPIAFEENHHNIHQKPEVNILNALNQNIHPHNVPKTLGTGLTESIYHTELETHNNIGPFKLQICRSACNLVPPQPKHQFHHANHQLGSQDRKPLGNMNSTSVMGMPRHGSHSHQAGLCGGTTSPRSHPFRRQPCRFYLQGKCWYGEMCKFLHE